MAFFLEVEYCAIDSPNLQGGALSLKQNILETGHVIRKELEWVPSQVVSHALHPMQDVLRKPRSAPQTEALVELFQLTDEEVSKFFWP